MNQTTKTKLLAFLNGIPPLKRKIYPDISHPNDEKRLILVAQSLLENNDSIEIDDIRIVCEEIGCEEYSHLLSDTDKFKETFAAKVFSRIDDVKNIISTYKDITD